MKKDKNRYPKGWNAAKVRRVLEHHEKLSDDDSAREIETAPIVGPSAWIEVPVDLIPQVKKLIARHKKSA